MLFERTDRKLLRRIWSLTWPLMAANALELAVALVDLLLVRPLGPAATAAIGVSRQVTFLVEALVVAIAAGTLALISQGIGARASPVPATGGGGNKPATERLRVFDPDDVVRQSLGLVPLLGLPAALAGYWLAGPLLVWLQASAETQAHGEPYLQVYFAGLVLIWGNAVAATLFRGASDVRTPLKVGLGVGLLQVVLDCGLIHGAGPLPAFGVQGAALAAVAARAAGMLAFLVLLARGTGALRLRWSARPSFDWRMIQRILRIGLPMALANLLRHGSRVVFLGIVGVSVLQETLQAAVGVGFQLRLIGVLPALAVQTAAATLVGQAMGRGELAQAEEVGKRSVHLLALIVGFLGTIVVVLAHPLAELFIDADEGAALTAQVLRWFAVAQFFSALSIGTQGALMGAGDTLPALRYTLLSEWCLMLPLAYCLVALDWVPDGLLAAWVLAPALTLILMQRRFRGRYWQGT